MSQPAGSTEKIQWFEWALLLAALAVILLVVSLW